MTAPLRFGILGAAGITPSALIAPATENPEVELYAVAARNRATVISRNVCGGSAIRRSERSALSIRQI